MYQIDQDSNETIENMVRIICDQYLTQVFQFIHFWVNDIGVAEELTLKAIKKALARSGACNNLGDTFLKAVLTAARKEIQDHSGVRFANRALMQLSSQEQEVFSLKFGAALSNQRISGIIGLPESNVSIMVCEALSKINDYMDIPI